MAKPKVIYKDTGGKAWNIQDEVTWDSEAKHSRLQVLRGVSGIRAPPSAPREPHPAPAGRIQPPEPLPLSSAPTERVGAQGSRKETGWAWERWGGTEPPILPSSNSHLPPRLLAQVTVASSRGHLLLPLGTLPLHGPAHSRPFSFHPRPLAPLPPETAPNLPLPPASPSLALA